MMTQSNDFDELAADMDAWADAQKRIETRPEYKQADSTLLLIVFALVISAVLGIGLWFALNAKDWLAPLL